MPKSLRTVLAFSITVAIALVSLPSRASCSTDDTALFPEIASVLNFPGATSLDARFASATTNSPTSGGHSSSQASNHEEGGSFVLLDDNLQTLGADIHPALRRLFANWQSQSPSVPAAFSVTSTTIILDSEYAVDAPRVGARAPAKQVYRIDFEPPTGLGTTTQWDLKVFRMHPSAKSTDAIFRRSAEAFQETYSMSLQRVGTLGSTAHRLTSIARR